MVETFTEMVTRGREAKIMGSADVFKKKDLPELKSRILRKIKRWIVNEGWPMRPIPISLVMDFGIQDVGEYEIFIFVKFIENGGYGFDNVWLFDNTRETLDAVTELCDYIPELVELAETV